MGLREAPGPHSMPVYSCQRPWDPDKVPSFEEKRVPSAPSADSLRNLPFCWQLSRNQDQTDDMATHQQCWGRWARVPDASITTHCASHLHTRLLMDRARAKGAVLVGNDGDSDNGLSQQLAGARRVPGAGHPLSYTDHALTTPTSQTGS